MMQVLMWLLRVATFILAFVWVRANLHDVELFIGSKQLSMPLSALLILTLLVGLAIGFSAHLKLNTAHKKGS